MNVDMIVFTTGPLTPERLLREPSAVFLDVVRCGAWIVLGALVPGLLGGGVWFLATGRAEVLWGTLAVGLILGALVASAVLIVATLIALMYAVVWPFRRWFLPFTKAIRKRGERSWRTLFDPDLDIGARRGDDRLEMGTVRPSSLGTLRSTDPYEPT